MGKQFQLIVIIMIVFAVTTCSGPSEPTPPERPAPISFWIDTVSTLGGRSASVTVNMTYSPDPADALPPMNGLDILIQYENRGLVAYGVERGDALDGWEYYTYRFGTDSADSLFSQVRIVGIRDMNNDSHPGPATEFPSGCLATMSLDVAQSRNLFNTVSSFRFLLRECGDNTLTAGDDSTILHFPNMESNGIVVDPSYSIDSCPPWIQQAISHAPVEFVAGALTIEAPPGGDWCDLDGDGYYGVTDRCYFPRYLLAEWQPPDLLKDAVDCNGDGIVWTVADYEFQAELNHDDVPIEDLYDLPAPYTTTLEISATTSDSVWFYSFHSDADVGAVVLSIPVQEGNHPVPSWVGDIPVRLQSSTVSDTHRVLLTHFGSEDPGGTHWEHSLRIADLRVKESAHVSAEASSYPGAVMMVSIRSLDD